MKTEKKQDKMDPYPLPYMSCLCHIVLTYRIEDSIYMLKYSTSISIHHNMSGGSWCGTYIYVCDQCSFTLVTFTLITFPAYCCL